jgi:hypothetical protein
MHKYKVNYIALNYVTAEVQFISKENGSRLTAYMIYFRDETGEILQSALEFG